MKFLWSEITGITDAVTSGRGQTATYDDLNRIHQASGIYGGQTYVYDGVGNRQSLAISGTTTSYRGNNKSRRSASDLEELEVCMFAKGHGLMPEDKSGSTKCVE